MEHGRVEIANVDGVFGDIEGEIVGFAIGLTALDATARHPHREATRVVIPAVVFPRKTALAVDGAAEFATPDNKGAVEHTALLEILDEGPSGLINIFTLVLDVSG